MKTALFVDFDNIYLGLRKVDPAAAEQFATEPSRWLSWIEKGMSELGEPPRDPGRRRLLVRKCYLNPKTFHPYRHYFTRSAFEVVDCPPLTGQGKNSSDIRMVMDILDTLEHSTRFDEFIILSGDADFTPVLLRLRAHDRRTVVLTIGYAAEAYKAACDLVLTEDVFIEDALRLVSQQEEEALSSQRPPDFEELRRAIIVHVQRFVSNSTSAVPMATAAQSVIRAFGPHVTSTDWAGAGGFKNLLLNAGDLGLELMTAVAPGFIRDPRRHAPPPAPSSPAALGPPPTQGSGSAPTPATGMPRPTDSMAPPISQPATLERRLAQVTGTPALTREQYASLFRALCEVLEGNPYHLTYTSKAVRDVLAAGGESISRQAVTFVLRGVTYAGCALSESPRRWVPIELAKAFCKNVGYLAGDAQIELSEEERARLDDWIVGGLRDAVEAAVT
jgi:NYN domain